MNPSIRKHLAIPTLALAAALLAALPFTGSTASGSSGAEATPVATAAPSRTVHFEPNLGQTDPRVRYLGRAADFALFFTPQEVVVSLREPRVAGLDGRGAVLPAAELAEPSAPRSHVLRMKARGASAATRVEAGHELDGTSSYFRLDGRPSVAAVPHFAEVRYRNLYPGIDQVFYGNGGVLEYDFVVAPGADPGAIELAFEGADGVAIDGAGNLVLSTSIGNVVQPPPAIYQQVGGERLPVAGSYRLTSGTPAGVAFTVAAYDRSRELVIDPQVVFRACIGGSSADWARAIKVTPNGQAYIAGDTYSTDFPAHAGAVQPGDLDPDTNTTDGFVAKLNLAGTAFTHATYIGGARAQQITDIGLDGGNSVYVAGITQQPGSPQGSWILDAFVVKLDSTLSTLLWSRTLGGTQTDYALGIAVNGAGDAFVSGATYSPDFCTSGILFGCGIDSAFAGSTEAFVVKLNRHGAVRYATFLGAADNEFGQGIAIDDADRAYVVVARHNGNPYVTRIDASGTFLEYTRVLSGSGIPSGIAVDGLYQAHVTGWTADGNFYTSPGAYKRQISGLTDGFVTALRGDGTCCVYSTFVGDARYENLHGIALDFRRQPYVVGTAWPVTNGVVDWNYGQALVLRLNEWGTQLLSQQELGGAAYESGEDIDLDYNPLTFVAGITSSSNFAPGVPGCAANDTGNDQAFVVKLAM